MISYTLVGDGDDANVVVWIPGRSPLVAHSSHPRFEEIVQGARDGDESVVSLFDLAETVAERFEDLSERVSVANGRVYFDGDEVPGTISDHIVRFLDEGRSDWMPLVRFLENVGQNPNEHSRTMLYDWLQSERFTITADGMIVGYKGVRVGTDEDGNEVLSSIHSGRAIVDGTVVVGNIPNAVGSVLTMPRESVAFNPADGCSTGLHVGTFEYASGFAQGAILEVHVHPRDVVSVPTDCSAQKMRVCRYVVAGKILAPWTTAVRPYDWTDEYDEYDGEEDWSDGDEDY
jgi:hypothetical protein